MKTILRKQKQITVEEGFTLIEIMIAVVIIGILAAISAMVMGAQIRSSHIATLKSDIRSNTPYVLDVKGKIVTPEYFASQVKSTGTNVVSLAVDGSNEPGGTQIACIWGSRFFGDNDVESYYWSSENGKLESGTCLGKYPDAVIVGTSDPAEEPVEEAPTDPEHPEVGGENGGGEPPLLPPTDVTPENPDTETTPENPATIRVIICHSQGNDKQSRWTSISPNNNGTLHGHIPNHGTDIVPPITGILPDGFNWTPENIEIWNNDCKKV